MRRHVEADVERQLLDVVRGQHDPGTDEQPAERRRRDREAPPRPLHEHRQRADGEQDAEQPRPERDEGLVGPRESARQIRMSRPRDACRRPRRVARAAELPPGPGGQTEPGRTREERRWPVLVDDGEDELVRARLEPQRHTTLLLPDVHVPRRGEHRSSVQEHLGNAQRTQDEHRVSRRPCGHGGAEVGHVEAGVP